jgi:L-lysine 6-transaminase
MNKYPDKITNARGLGLMCAFDLFTPEKRDQLVKKLYDNGMIILGCGATTIRFRPPLIFSSNDVDEAISIIDKTLKDF